MKTILVPTDFSEEAHHATHVAAQLAKASDAKLKVIHIIEIPTGSSFNTIGEVDASSFMLDRIMISRLVEVRKEKLKELEKSSVFRGVKVESEIIFGNPYAGISKEIAKIKANLVIMGSKGSSGIEEVLIGSNTEKVVRQALCPVLTIKKDVSIKKLKNIVFATNFSEEVKGVTKEIKKLQEILGAKIHLVKINTPNSFETEREVKKAAQVFIKTHQISNTQVHIYNALSEEDGIIHFAEDYKMDMIAMATHGRTGFMHLLSGSIAEDVVNHAQRPVWTMTIKK